MAVNSTNLVVSDQPPDNKIFVYALPATSSSQPYATFPATTGINAITFGPGGALYHATTSVTVNIFSPPFSNSTTVSNTVTLPQPATGLVFDAAGTLYACDIGQNIYVMNGSTVTTHVVAPNGTVCRGVAVTTTQLLLADLAGGVQVYNLPLTTGSTPVATMTTGMSEPEGDALDSAGNLYVVNGTTSTITAYAPPFASASTPFATIDLGPLTTLFGVAVAP